MWARVWGSKSEEAVEGRVFAVRGVVTTGPPPNPNLCPQTWQTLKKDPTFWEEFRSYYPYIGRPSSCHPAPRMTEFAGGARIWLKREDLNHTGAHKINNAVGQVRGPAASELHACAWMRKIVGYGARV